MEKLFKIKWGNIFDYKADAIVIPAHPEVPKYKKGDDYCIEADAYNLAGIKNLTNARKEIGELMPGEAKETPAFGLSDRYNYLIHTTYFLANTYESWESLERSYYNSLALADKLKCKSIVFPLLATGCCEFPKGEGFDVAQTVISTYLNKTRSEMNVTLVLTKVDYHELILEAKYDYMTSVKELDEQLKGKSVKEIKNKAESDELYALFAHQLQLRERLKRESKEQIKSHKTDEVFSFYELVQIKKKELGYTYESLALDIDEDEKKIKRIINGDTKRPKTDEILLKIGYHLEFNLYQMNRTLEMFDFPILKGENLDEDHAMFYYSFLHGLFDKDYFLDRKEEMEREENL